MKLLHTMSIAPLTMLAASSQAWAHPGHGSGSNPTGPTHYLTEPVHAVVLVSGLLIGLGIAYLARKAFGSSRVGTSAKFQ